MGNCPSQASPMLVLTRGCSSSQSDSAWVPSTWFIPQEQPAAAWVSHGVTNSASKSAPTWAPLSTGPQVLPGACSSVGSPHSPPSCNLLLQKGVLHGLWVTCSTLDLNGLRRNILPHLGLLQGCRGISGTWSISSFSLTGLGVYESVFLTYSHFSSGCFAQQFPPFFNGLCFGK